MLTLGNPPYQEDVKNEGDRANPVYDKFMDAAYQVADVVELIHPARFLFNAGQTPKGWNKKMLEDEHLKVLRYEPDASKVFPNTDIKGGVAITLHDDNKSFGTIGTFTAFSELNTILSRIKPHIVASSFADIFVPYMYFNLELLINDYPDYKTEIGNEGKDRLLRTNIFDRIPLFTEQKVEDESSKILGVRNKTRVWRYFPIRYLDEKACINLRKWKVLIPKANGSGAIGEVLSTPLVGEPLVGYTQTFFGIGSFDTQAEAENCMKYVKSKFARVMLGILKTTQDNPPEKWRYVPLQDFTSSSDIDWSKSIHEIDLQLYRKYGLDEAEIEFIETHVKEME